jgi:hypothetical protein
MVSLIADRWILGEFLCHLDEHSASVGSAATMWLTGYLSFCKFLTIKFPFRTRAWSKSHAHKVCGIIWGLCLISPTQLMLYYILATSSSPIEFEYTSYSCDYIYKIAPNWLDKLSDIYAFLSFALVYMVLILSSGYLLMKARIGAAERQRAVPWPGVLAVILTATTLIVSFLPYNVFRISHIFRPGHHEYGVQQWRIVIYFQNINIVANFLIFALTVQSFREFLKTKFQAAVFLCCHSTKVSGHEVELSTGLATL